MSNRNVKTWRYLYAYQFSHDPDSGIEGDQPWVVSDQYFESDHEFEATMMAGRVKMRYRKLAWSELETHEIKSWSPAN